MKRRARRTIAVAVAAAGVAVLAVAVATHSRGVLEWWHLRALEDPDASPADRAAAAERLGAVGSARSIPRLMSHVAVEVGNLKRRRLEALAARIQIARVDPPFVELWPATEKRIAELDRQIAELDAQIEVRFERDVFLVAIADITAREGRRAVPALLRELGADDWQAAWSAARVLGDLGPEEAAGAVPGLEAALDGDRSIVAAAAGAALERIRGERAHAPGNGW